MVAADTEGTVDNVGSTVVAVADTVDTVGTAVDYFDIVADNTDRRCCWWCAQLLWLKRNHNSHVVEYTSGYGAHLS